MTWLPRGFSTGEEALPWHTFQTHHYIFYCELRINLLTYIRLL